MTAAIPLTDRGVAPTVGALLLRPSAPRARVAAGSPGAETRRRRTQPKMTANGSWAAQAPEIGVSLNNLRGITQRSYGLADVLAAAREAEALGFDAVWLHDAPLGRRTVASYDTPLLLGAIASVTERVRLCTGILQPHLR